jgi:NADH-quinone oxidoreductase subunit C
METAALLDLIVARFPGRILNVSAEGPDAALIVPRDVLPDLAAALKNEPFGFGMLLDLTCVDYPERAERFELVYHLLSMASHRRVKLTCALPADAPSVASLTPLWKNADWLEREVFDMFGVRFDGHPDLRRLLTYDGFEGHPLRKDYPLRKRQPRLAMRT